ncbi:TRAFs-binding domain-containing protein [Chitinophaga silvisoli]|uniref:DUF4071 domain-containing protein n=1 Tax=Chitinophaga silvisoli TaxID=2291814 RepID=A0A3E1P385_9BACT|nr:TRAFs-binding domain-containing protein [Chitinophaga silvisoli]RFM34666.1 DUF4071 domain-containing protein [Chitinophaga silvisoli]
MNNEALKQGTVEKTCFVIIGFGKKMDHANGREIDLDKTYKYIIEPVFKKLGFFCFRACDIAHSGVIDQPMYDNILKADFVVADLTTFNPNVLYELGVRHAVRKHTTIVISDDKNVLPFDLSHVNIDKYQHMGNGIDHGEVTRFCDYLEEKVRQLMAAPAVDSPLYALYPSLQVPVFTPKEVNEIKENIKEIGSLSDYITMAEDFKRSKDYTAAIKVLRQAKKLNQDNVLVTQRLALCTYKSELPDAKQALEDAAKILEELHPDTSTDLETLGLCGAINKRLYAVTGEMEYLNKAAWFYDKGFYIGSDYYNGINAAYIFNVLANLEQDFYESNAHFGNARKIRKRVIEICKGLMADEKWEGREDKEWVYLTMAEAYVGLDEPGVEEEWLEKVRKVANGEFSMQSYLEQRAKLQKELDQFKNKIIL